MKHVFVLTKVSLILIMALGFLRLEAQTARAEDTNPPPADETTGGASPSTDNSAGGASTGGSSSTDTSSSPGLSAASDPASNPPDPSTSTDDEATNPADSSTSPGDDATNPADSSTSTGDDATNPADSSTSTGDDATNPADSLTSPDNAASNPTDASTSTGDGESTPTADELIENAAEKDITLADGDGQPLSAADTEAQDLLTSVTSDPWFNAGGGVFIGYTSGSGCAGFITLCHSNQTNSIQAAIDDPLSAGKVIRIEPGDYSTETFTLNDNSRSFNLAGNTLVNTINLNTNYSLVSVFNGFFSALNIWLNFGGPKTATLQQGVNLTQSGGTLNVASKTYNESVTVAGTKDGMQIIGHNNPIQDGTGKGPYGFNVHADDVTISGFTIQNNYGAGINLPSGGSVVAHDNKFYRNYTGVRVINGSSAVLSNNTFGDAADPFKGNYYGVYTQVLGAVPPTVNRTVNQFLRNTYGAYLWFGATGVFSGDEFRQNTNTGLVLAGGSADVTGSTFAGNFLGASVFNSSAFTSSGNTYTGNGIGADVWGFGYPTATFVYDNFESNGIGIKSGKPNGTQAHFSRFYNNGLGILNYGFGLLQAGNNWWGSNQGPSVSGSTAGNVDTPNWLVLDMSPSDDPIFTGGDTSLLTTQMMSSDGTTKTPLSSLDTAGILGNWFNYTSAPSLQTPGMGTMSGNTFASGSQTGDALFSDTQFDDETPTTKVTIIDAPTFVNPSGPALPSNPGSPLPPAPAPALQAVIPVTGDNLVDLICGDASQLLMANGNSVVIPSLTPCTMQASLQPEAKETLPGPLPDGVQFLDGLSVTVVNGGNALDKLPQESFMQVNFAATQARLSGSLAVYWWDGNAWQEVPDSGLGAAASNNTGLFVLVTIL